MSMAKVCLCLLLVYPHALCELSLSALLQKYCEALSALYNVTGLYCNATTDEIGTCWPRSGSGRMVERPCPEYINGVKYNTTRSAYRECLENGTWAFRSNYSNCEPILEEKRKYPVHYKIALIINYLGHCISVGALVVAFILFLCLRSIRCLRNIIHWNLITTFILRNVMWFLLQLIDHNIHESNEPWCRLITTIYNYFVVTNFFWMFVEGCYLHTAIVMTYSTDKLRKWVFLFIGWCIPCPIIVAWAIGKLYNENEQASLCLCFTAFLMERCVRLPGSGGTGGRTTTPFVCEWPGPCLSPPHQPASASTASSRPLHCDLWIALLLFESHMDTSSVTVGRTASAVRFPGEVCNVLHVVLNENC
ncbi:corticotropin-releasing factor receptor 2 isoform X4 [Denticeps clupeoides]|uniref:corticotropin-releasing factor receptor 2 isoform X4 n=1 Tax=Denticeps clupeoides TaxID=299321 RepID=UPI0010A4C661|nr:corticotropin-releasing factor receptor 2 isoform X4 [Denticeps clupeoides]